MPSELVWLILALTAGLTSSYTTRVMARGDQPPREASIQARVLLPQAREGLAPVGRQERQAVRLRIRQLPEYRFDLIDTHASGPSGR